MIANEKKRWKFSPWRKLNSGRNTNSSFQNSHQPKEHNNKTDKNLNVFQKFGRQLSLRFTSRQKVTKESSLHELNTLNETGNASCACKNEGISNDPPTQSFNEKSLETETPTYTHYYKSYLSKKWLENELGPDLVMYKASSEMLSHVWYWGEISRFDAQRQLTDKPNGAFLVRDSETKSTQFALSFRIGKWTLHYRLLYEDHYWHFEDLRYESIVEMIEDIMHRSNDENFVCFVKVPSEMQPPFPVSLKYPISRYYKIPTLQDFCRHTIQRNIDHNKIKELPIPIKLQNFLQEQQTQIV